MKEIAEDRLAAAPVDLDNSGCCGSVHVRFNHYNSAFPIHNGVLKWELVDEKYSISFVYRGNYVRNLEYISSQPNLRPLSDNSETRYAARDDMVHENALLCVMLFDGCMNFNVFTVCTLHVYAFSMYVCMYVACMHVDSIIE